MKLKILVLFGGMYCFLMQGMMFDIVDKGGGVPVNDAIIDSANDLTWDAKANSGHGGFSESLYNFFKALRAEQTALNELTGEKQNRDQWDFMVDVMTAEALFLNLIESGVVPGRVYVPKEAKALLKEALQPFSEFMKKLSSYKIYNGNIQAIFNAQTPPFSEKIAQIARARMGTNVQLVDYYKTVNTAAKKGYKSVTTSINPLRKIPAPPKPPLLLKPVDVKAIQNKLHALAESLAVLQAKAT